MRASSITLAAPAKINISLCLCGKRSDGYHEIETLMVPITLADEVTITHAPGIVPGCLTFTCDDPSLPSGAENICVKAFHAFQEATGIQESMAISLLKKIPHGAGLGGGSSDAAAVLSGLNGLFKEPLTRKKLHKLAASLGSDVPFFLQKQPAWCCGRGEQVFKATPLPSWNILLIKPPFSIESRWAYQQWDSKTWLQERPINIGKITIFNHLEPPVFEKYLLLPVLKEWLQQRPEISTAWMSGSGSTMIALVHQELTSVENQQLETELQASFGESFWVARSQLKGNME